MAAAAGGPRLVALNAAAERCGLAAGELLSSARAKALDLQSRDADPAADAAALRRLALWGLRYTPTVACWGEADGADGLHLDIAGCAHLFGGERRLLADLAARLRRFGLDPRLAIADTPGAAWALAHHGAAIPSPTLLRTGGGGGAQDSPAGTIVPPGGEAEALRDLPVGALRLDEETRVLLRRLGFRRIGELLGQPRAPFTRRFGAALLRRLDQALGRAAEPLAPVVPPPAYRAQARFAEPIRSEAHVLEAARRLLRRLARDLERDGVGARRLSLLLFRVDGEVPTLELGLAAPSRDGEHVARLIALRLDRLADGLDAGFGFEAASIHVLVAAPMRASQVALLGGGAAGEPAALSRLVDRLEQRLGAGSVSRLHPRESHIPERAVAARPAAEGPGDWSAGTPSGAARPLLLLPCPEPAEVTALIPEGPPRQFRWRGVLHPVARADGPERLAPEWWRLAPQGRPETGPRAGGNARERDYYLVEDAEGRRFWLYRDGRHGGGEAMPRWYVHGLFP